MNITEILAQLTKFQSEDIENLRKAAEIIVRLESVISRLEKRISDIEGEHHSLKEQFDAHLEMYHSAYSGEN